MLVLFCVTAHEQPVGGFAAGVIHERLLGGVSGEAGISELEVRFTQVLEHLQVEVFKLALLREVPLGSVVVVEQRAPIDLDGVLVLGDCLSTLARVVVRLAAIDGCEELIPVNPPSQAGVEQIAAVRIKDAMARSLSLQRTPQVVQRDIQVVAGRPAGMARPEGLHEYLASGGLVGVEDEILEQRPCFEASQPRDVVSVDGDVQ